MTTLRPRRRAFTLIELLIVITIIGILAAALLPRITSGPAKARDAQRKADMQQIATALEFWADDNGGVYPGTNETTECITTGDAATGDALEAYLTSLPEDPQGVLTVGSDAACDTGYLYRPLNATTSYIIAANLENDNASGEGVFENFSDVAITAPDDAALVACTTDCVYVVGR